MIPALEGRLVLVGAGKMGGAMLAGWLERGIRADAVAVVEPQPSPDLAELAASSGFALNPDLAAMDDASVVVLAVKPQAMDAALTGVVGLGRSKPVVLSIAAGRTIASFEAAFGTGAAIVRAMPNTPAAIGRGITVACANGAVSESQKALATALLEAVGEVAWIDDEGMIDAVTALSGGGPAYVFLLAECMAAAGVAAGLPQDLATRLARVTVSGAGELMHRSSEEAATLRSNVTSPGGTTAEALKVLMAKGALPDLMVEAIAAATRRSKDLAD
jgi:pyrroline-5-carboxylate reductase